MNDLGSKITILKQHIIIGELTYLKVKNGQLTNILSRINDREKINIFNKVDKNYLKNLNKQPWNVFFDIHIKKTNKKIGFIWLVINHDINLDVTFHGGGWEKSLMKGLYYTDVLFSLLSYLKKEFKIIRTSCYKENVKAKKLIEFVGFKLHTEKDSYCFYIF
jgi:hypothetical protein